MKLFTIGFTQKTAEQFFNILKNQGVDYILDVRLNNTSQLSRFAHGKDLPYLLKEIAGIKYKHIGELAPSEDLLKSYQKKQTSWNEYEVIYNGQVKDIDIKALIPEDAEKPCLLCSESTAEECHRRLAAEYIRGCFANTSIEHL